MTIAFEILAVCGRKSHLKTTYATMPCDLTIYKVAVHFFSYYPRSVIIRTCAVYFCPIVKLKSSQETSTII